jgi:hypothetical protein
MNMIVGTAVLTAAASEIKTSVTQPDAILKLIAGHKAATAASDEAAHHYSNLEETLPADRCRGDLACDVKKFVNDDPRGPRLPIGSTLRSKKRMRSRLRCWIPRSPVLPR